MILKISLAEPQGMLSICLIFLEIELQYAYKRYAYKINECILAKTNTAPLKTQTVADDSFQFLLNISKSKHCKRYGH